MLFHVEMQVRLHHDMRAEIADRLKATERERSHALQRSGAWRHLWRIAGAYANISVFNVDSIDALHEMLSALPLFPYMTIRVTPLCRHPSSICDDDR